MVRVQKMCARPATSWAHPHATEGIPTMSVGIFSSRAALGFNRKTRESVNS